MLRSTSYRTRPRTARAAAGRAPRAAGAVAALLLAGAPLTAPGSPAQALAGPTFVVTSTGDAPDARRNGTCATAAGDCTLRAALTEAGAAVGHASVAFAIPGAGPHTIAPATKLPALTNPEGTTVDGYTEPDARVNTDARASNARIAVQIRGKGPAGFDIFSIATPGNVVRGLAVYDVPSAFSLAGPGADRNRIVGNFVCTDASGTFRSDRVHTSGLGILLTQGAGDNVIGAPAPADRNVVSGCYHRGIVVAFSGSTGNKVQNNIIGLSPSGATALPNRSHGLDINYTGSNLAGGSGPGEGNVISGNAGAGVEISHSDKTNENQVVGNLIGTDLTGEAAPSYARNGQMGVRLEGPKFCADPARQNPQGCTTSGVAEGLPHHNTVRGNVIVNNAKGGVLIDKGQHHNTVEGNWIGVTRRGAAAPNLLHGVRIERGSYENDIAANTIAYNPRGILISSTGSYPIGPEQRTYSNTISRNSIFANSAAGIDLQPFGTADGSALVQDDIRRPVLSRATASSVSGSACGGCTVEVYAADSAGSSEGRTFLGSATAAADGSFTATFSSSQALRTPVTALATDRAGNSSEFAAAVLARA